ncbi:carbohydrate ABC transporter permease [Vallitalea pronyensis]|uniref:Carbohydrate ABC transporter permease n=1 Tax=Vallitalea pronyensis TaxID=1348613 RepID=A0A8J8SGV5_9FIRM|nr:carbohydrate ABC transporter permease [Vallitalea pronyensis]QUI22767.1 carbohydrate ABC transporter permease [Vallitalea pronyensis]
MSRIFNYKNFLRLNHVIMFVLVLLTLFPFLYMLAVSFSSSRAVMASEVFLLPKDFNLVAYSHVLKQDQFWIGYKNTVLYTALGTSISLTLTIMAAYPLSKKNLYGGPLVMKFMIFTMFFSGGLIPNFILIRDLGLYDTMWAMVLPGAMNAYNVMIMKTFFQGIPDDLKSAAKIDGLTDIGVLMRVVLPLSKPIIATIGLFMAVWLWNEWFMSLIYLKSDVKRPVAMYLRNIVLGAMNTIKSGQQMDQHSAKTVPATLQASTIMLTSIPILCVYPFVQKYFAKGILIGSVKG